MLVVSKRPWQLCLTGISIVGTLVTVFFAPDHPFKHVAIYVLLVIVAVSIVWSLFGIVTSSFHKRPLQVTSTPLDIEFDEAWHMGNAIYSTIRKQYPPENVVRGWWGKYPSGIIRICDQSDQLWGYLSMWPICREVFLKLKSGGMSENQIEEKHIEPVEKAPFQYWYIADICRKKRPSGASPKFSEYMVYELIGGALKSIKKNKMFADHLELLAFAATTAGEALLKKHDFIRVPPTSSPPEVNKIYARKMTKRSLNELLAKCDAIVKRNESTAHGIL